MKKYIISCSISLMALTIAGCSHKQPERIMTYITTDSAPVASDNLSTQQALMQASNSVSTSMQHLAAVQAAAHPHAKPAAPLNAKQVGMAQRVSINWIGPVQPLLKKVAHNAGYRLKVIGKHPSMPIIISINVRNKPLAEIYRSIMYQAQSQASIHLYAKQRTIELNYKN